MLNGRIKVINKNQNSDLIGGNFKNITSQTVINLGSFSIDSNFTGKINKDYTNQISSFVKPITLETLSIDNVTSEKILNLSTNVKINFDRSDLRKYVKYGSSRELFRTTIEQIIINYPVSLYVNSQLEAGGNVTLFDRIYNTYSNVTNISIPSSSIDNKYGFVFNAGNTSEPDGNVLKNMNISYNEYNIWMSDDSDNNYEVVGFTGDSNSRPYVVIQVVGDPFSSVTGLTGRIDFHFKPKVTHFNKFLLNLNDLEKYFLTKRLENNSGFEFMIKQPLISDSGQIIYSDKNLKWTTTDKYNVDFSGGKYEKFLQQILNIGENYDTAKTDLIARFLTPDSLTLYDETDEQKISKLLRIYGREFDEIRILIDSLVNINKVSYSKKENLPDQIVKNFAKTLGWEEFSIIKEEDLINSFFSTEYEETNNTLTPAEIDIELWRRIIINTNYYWKSKGTRHAIKSMFLLIGIPEPFINISEYIYTVDGKINPNNIRLSLEDLPSTTLPYDSDGYPIAPVETNDFYFQMSGDTDSGQAYMDVFRQVGFNLNRIVDNKKSWVEDGKVERTHYTTPNYYQEDSKLILNTKEIDVTLDVSRGVEYDVFEYIKNYDYPINSTGFTSPYVFVNLSAGYTSPANIFTIPNDPKGGVQVSFNGVTLTSGTTGNGDYYQNGLNPREITLHTGDAITNNNRRDVVTITYMYEKLGIPTQGEVQYLVVQVTPNPSGTIIPLPDVPKGTVQLTLNGISLTQGTSLFVGDYIIDPNNTQQLIVQNSDLVTYLQNNQILQVAYITGDDEVNLEKKAEFHRVDNLNGTKFYKNNSINKFVFKLNYKILDIENVKFTVNGVTLEPGTDYQLNSTNQYEIFLPPSIKLGDVLSAYYIVGGTSTNEVIVSDVFGLGDISEMSFLEFLELVQRRMINAKNIKTITDYRGGFYPTIENIYSQYLSRYNLPTDHQLKSNGYTFSNLYPFLNKYNAFFKKFVTQLLPSTIILRKNGILIRNTIFTKQKHTYKRGVNFNQNVNWLGNDGSEFKNFIGYNVYWVGKTCLFPVFIEAIEYKWSEGKVAFPYVEYKWSEGKVAIPYIEYKWSEGKVALPYIEYKWSEGKVAFPPVEYKWSEGKVAFPPVEYKWSEGKVALPYIEYKWSEAKVALLPIEYK